MTVRYALLTGHPRKQLNFTLDSLRCRRERAGDAARLRAVAGAAAARTGAFAPAWDALRDDLNVPAALGAIFTVVNRGPQGVDGPNSRRSWESSGWSPPPARRQRPRSRRPSPPWPRGAGPPSGPGTSRGPTSCAPNWPPPAGPCWTARTATGLSRLRK
jgi:hypothetical protein